MRREKHRPRAVFAVVSLCAAFLALGVGLWWFFGISGGPQAAGFLERALGSALRAEARILGFRTEGIGAAAGNLELRGLPGSPIGSLQAESLSAPCDWRALLRGNFHLHEVRADRVEASFKDPVAEGETAGPQGPGGDAGRFRIGRFSIRSADLSYGGGKISGLAVQAVRFGDSWNIKGSGGELSVPGIPKLGVEKIEIRESGGIFTLASSSFALGNGSVSATGSSAAPAVLDAKFEGIPPSDLVPGLPAGCLRGFASGWVQLRPNEPVRGSFSVADAAIAGLPLQQSISEFLGDRSLLGVPFQKFSADFSFGGGGWNISNIQLSSEGKVAARGSIRIGAGGQLSGRLELGVSERILAALPGAREGVFRNEGDGFWWSPLALGGTVAQPTEDLSRKLAPHIAGGLLIKHGADAAGAVPETAVDAAKGVIELLSPFLR